VINQLNSKIFYCTIIAYIAQFYDMKMEKLSGQKGAGA
jgi:hypothetical protein